MQQVFSPGRQTVQETIRFLQENADNIAGLLLVTYARGGTKLVDSAHEDGEGGQQSIIAVDVDHVTKERAGKLAIQCSALTRGLAAMANEEVSAIRHSHHAGPPMEFGGPVTPEMMKDLMRALSDHG